MAEEAGQNEKPAITPFLKWAGGKRWLIGRHPQLFPKTFHAYYEPFLGSGAIFFSLRPARGRISDANPELINLYKAIKSSPSSVRRALKKHDNAHSDSYYYKVRSSEPAYTVGQAARTLYLNRSCWNGLYRVNRKGEFNVPRGTKNAILLPTDDFLEASRSLHRISIACCDFSETLALAKRGDFAFIDPPYTVSHNNNGFIKYNESIFTWKDQLRLGEEVKRAAKKGVKLLVTNADHGPIRALYSELGHIHSLPRASIISGENKGRRGTTEMIVTINYKTHLDG